MAPYPHSRSVVRNDIHTHLVDPGGIVVRNCLRCGQRTAQLYHLTIGDKVWPVCYHCAKRIQKDLHLKERRKWKQ